MWQIGHIDILQLLFGRVIIPTAVRDELTAPAAPEPVRLFVLNQPDWLEVVSPITSDPALARFGLGERQAIILAHELRADLLVADDMEARNEAESRQLAVIGTLGVLKLAAGRRLIDFPQEIARLRDAGFHASDTLVKKLLDE